ncbi:hypothetical protein [Nonomuraea sp. NPDC050691]|uniref:hypothetical protein n=1 Tax=Nonomuraea sp. NPDC050691 TaxID=3155661 RepID=UPI0033C3AE9E
MWTEERFDFDVSGQETAATTGCATWCASPSRPAGRRSSSAERCAAIGRDPASPTRSTQVTVSYEDPAATRALVKELAGLGLTHIVLNVRPPFPEGVARWVAEEIISPLLG